MIIEKQVIKNYSIYVLEVGELFFLDEDLVKVLSFEIKERDSDYSPFYPEYTVEIIDSYDSKNIGKVLVVSEEIKKDSFWKYGASKFQHLSGYPYCWRIRIDEERKTPLELIRNPKGENRIIKHEKSYEIVYFDSLWKEIRHKIFSDYDFEEDDLKLLEDNISELENIDYCTVGFEENGSKIKGYRFTFKNDIELIIV